MQESKPVRALVTGASGAIGTAITLGLARAGFETILVCRNEARGSQCISKIRNSIPDANLTLELCDLSSPKSILELARRCPQELEILVNNAAQCPPGKEITDDGLERQFATNILAYAAMSEAFEHCLVEGSRIINVASYWAGGLDLSDLQFEKRGYNNDRAYRQSKQGDRMLTAAYARHFSKRGIRVFSCHSGDVHSKLSHDLGFGGHESPEEGAATPLYLCLESLGNLPSTGYFEHGREVSDPFIQDSKAVNQLFEFCRSLLQPFLKTYR